MRASRAFVIAFAAFGALGAAQAPANVELTWHVPATGVAVGEPFFCEVRGGSPTMQRVAFDPAALWPVAIEAIAADGGAQRWRARAFAAGELAFAPFVVHVHDAAGVVDAVCVPPPLVVRSLLRDPESAIEWPGDVRAAAPRGSWWWWIGLLCVVGWSFARRWQRSRPAVVAPSVAARASLAERTAQRLAALALPRDDATTMAFAMELAAIVREHAGEHFGLRAGTRTTAELLGSVDAGAAMPLRECLDCCDLVKFARHLPDVAACEAARTAGHAFVRATATSPGAS